MFDTIEAYLSAKILRSLDSGQLRKNHVCRTARLPPA